jgi:site-specific recombinase XerD
MNISEHTTKYKQELKRRGYSKNTIDTYLSNVCIFFKKQIKDHPKNITQEDITSFLSFFNEPNTQRSYHSAIKLFYEICMRQPNKFKYIPYARKSKKLPIVLSQDEVQRMFSVCENLKHKVILALLYSTGMRVSELINLKWEHIDRSRMIINIIQAKGAKDRQVMLAPNLIVLLTEYYRLYKSKIYVLNGWKNQLQYSDRSVGLLVKKIAEKAGIQKRVYTHLMRHNSFTHMLEHGVDISIIQKIAGHTNPKTTQIYTHISGSLVSKTYSPLSSIVLN